MRRHCSCSHARNLLYGAPCLGCILSLSGNIFLLGDFHYSCVRRINIQSRTFKCSLDHAKRSFYRAVNGIFGRIDRMVSEEVILELIKTKCLPILLYGLEVCPLSKTNLRSLDFPINRFFMKLFNTSDMQIITECQSIFNFRLPSVITPDWCETFRVLQ